MDLQITADNDSIRIHPEQKHLSNDLFFEESPKIYQFEITPDASHDGFNLMHSRYYWNVETKYAGGEWRGNQMYFRLPSK